MPPPDIRQLRDLTRHRRAVIDERGRETQRLHKTLEDAGLKLASVASRTLSVSGRAMLEALIAGERDPEVLAELAKGRLRAKIPQLREALESRFNDHHALVVAEMLARIDHADATVERLSTASPNCAGPTPARSNCYAPSPASPSAPPKVILAERGADMSRFPSSAHLASWAGMCPGNNESAGKHHSGKHTVTLDAATATPSR